MKRVLTILFLSISLLNYSQELKRNQDEIINAYSTELNLNKKETKKLASIIESYSIKLHKKNIDSKEFNTLLKKQTLEMYELLSKEQFAIYKTLKSKYQPELNYRFN